MTDAGLGAYIQDHRQRLGLTQGQLAERAGINRAHLSQIEGGRITLPSADMRRRIAHALGVPHIDLLVAAGELLPSEVSGVTVQAVDFPANSPAGRGVEIMRTLPDEMCRWILGTAEFAEREARGERDDDLTITVNTARRKVGT
jgi:transcriptional regulator with XRE-family HTH domain